VRQCASALRVQAYLRSLWRCRSHQQGWCFIPISGRPALGYVECPRPAAVNAAGRYWRVRAQTGPGTHWRRPQPGPKASSSAGSVSCRKYQRAGAIGRRDAGETLATIAKGYGIAISMISRLSSLSTGAWSAAELDQSRHRTEMNRRGDRYRREPGKCNFPAWKPTYHDFPQTLRGG
jgi:hypothetical protein